MVCVYRSEVMYCVLYSIFPPSMHHRRAASDTSMFKRVGATDLKKDASSNHSSRSATPLVNSLLKLGGIYIHTYEFILSRGAMCDPGMKIFKSNKNY